MQHKYSTKDLPEIAGARIAILQSKWHREHTDKMVEKCMKVLRDVQALEPELHVLPGSLELPLAARRILRRGKKYDALIVFGAIVKGDTYHFELVMQMCMDGLNQVMMEEDTPIIIEVLPVTGVEQLVARSGDNEQNKGLEAAICAAEVITWRRAVPIDHTPKIGVRTS